ncbi:glycerate kinase, partial [Agathobacter sp.]
ALDMPEIMSYIYSKSWKLQFSASSSIIIIEDYYLQTFLHSLDDAVACNKEGIDAFFPIIRGATTLNEAMDIKNAQKNMKNTAEQVFRLIDISSLME